VTSPKATRISSRRTFASWALRTGTWPPSKDLHRGTITAQLDGKDTAVTFPCREGRHFRSWLRRRPRTALRALPPIAVLVNMVTGPPGTAQYPLCLRERLPRASHEAQITNVPRPSAKSSADTQNASAVSALQPTARRTEQKRRENHGR